MRFRLPGLLTVLFSVLLIGGGVASAGSASTSFSGYELFPGIRMGNTTKGATFAGWTDICQTSSEVPTCPPGVWVPPSGSTGGVVSDSVNYTGRPGFKKTVTIIGGMWGWQQPNSIAFHGLVLGGTVTWPEDATTNDGCGNGVALFNATISLDRSLSPAGTITGCLNDQLGLIPPQIWGEFALF